MFQGPPSSTVLGCRGISTFGDNKSKRTTFTSPTESHRVISYCINSTRV